VPDRKINIITGLFLLPSTLFWCSGVHKDGLILSAAGLIIYIVYKSLNSRFKVRYAFISLLCALLIFSLRNYVLFALVIALACWALSVKSRYKPIFVFSSIYLVGIILFFLMPVLIPALNFPAFIANKQHEFLLLDAGSSVFTEILQPTFSSFISFFPSAIDMAFLRPHLLEIKNFSYLPAAIEMIFLLALVAFSLIASKRNKGNLNNHFFLFCFFFSISIMVICGYTIPYSGAIVRYRSFIFPFLLTPLLILVKLPAQFNYKKIQYIFIFYFLYYFYIIQPVYFTFFPSEVAFLPFL
jgi:hypothetical protein